MFSSFVGFAIGGAVAGMTLGGAYTYAALKLKGKSFSVAKKKNAALKYRVVQKER